MDTTKLARAFSLNMVEKARADFWYYLPRNADVAWHARQILNGAGASIHSPGANCPCGGTCATYERGKPWTGEMCE
jgi:hypothetical protein